MTQYIVVSLTFLSTLFGGIVAVKNRSRMRHLLGYTAGVIMGVVAFDLLPEIFKMVQDLHMDSTFPMVSLMVGFLLFHITEKLLLIHHSHETQYGKHRHPQVGMLSAAALIGHSFLDGVGIGLGFQVSSKVGIAVAIAVIAHDFADGLNTVSLMLAHKNPVKRAMKALALDALVPIAGVISTLFFHLSDHDLVLYLGFFAGFLLYIGASDILPQAHDEQSSRLTIGLTVFGAAFIFAVTRFM